MKMKRLVSIAMALLLISSLPVTAFAAEWNIADGDITVNAGSGGQTVTQGTNVDIPDDAPVIKGSSTTNAVTIKADAGQTANVTLKDVNIDVSGTAGSAAVSTSGEGNVTIELEGTNAVQSGSYRAGLEKNNTGSLTITDTDNDGNLTATGGYTAAGIGGGNRGGGSDITISGGTINANGGQYAAGIGGGVGGNGSNIIISGGDVTATGGTYGAGIGGGRLGDGSSITISGGKVKANGGEKGAGIGGGQHIDGLGGDGSGITITGGDVTATGGNTGAGIGGGEHGSGSNITISDGKVTANGGIDGAGIGGGNSGNGSGITISGGDVTATGGDGGAGIGGGTSGSGRNITLSGGKTKAAGGLVGAGIGGGLSKDGSGITVSGDAQVKVQGGNKLGIYGTGAPIGNGGTWDDAYNPMDGEEVAPDVSELTPAGKIEYYAPGADMEKDAPMEDNTIIGTYVPEPEPNPEPDEDEIEADTQSAPLYRVPDKDGRDVTCKAEQKNGVLTVTVDADFAVLTGTLYGVSTLRAQGVETIVFVTKSAKSTFALAYLLEKGSRGETYKLTHDGKTVTFTLGAKMTDVSTILEKA